MRNIAKSLRVLFGSVVLLLTACATGGEPATETPSWRPATPVVAQPPLHKAVPLPLVDPTRPDTAQWEIFFDQLVVRNVNQPAIYTFTPRAADNNGKAVIILPGGGYQFISVENEGFPVAKRLRDAGYTAFVLQYRTRPTPVDPQAYLDEAVKTFGSLGKRPFPAYSPAVKDMRAALDYVASACEALNCSKSAPNVIGFSAGARTLIGSFTRATQTVPLSTIALIYPGMDQAIKPQPEAPLFLAIAQDDPLFTQGGFTLPQAWVEAGGSLELHLYATGGHGFGTLTKDKTSVGWLESYVRWLDAGT